MRDRTMRNHRRRIWAGAFIDLCSRSHGLQEGAGILNDRTEQLVECVSRRQDESGVVNLKSCLDHWSIDYMVCAIAMTVTLSANRSNTYREISPLVEPVEM